MYWHYFFTDSSRTSAVGIAIGPHIEKKWHGMEEKISNYFRRINCLHRVTSMIPGYFCIIYTVKSIFIEVKKREQLFSWSWTFHHCSLDIMIFTDPMESELRQMNRTAHRETPNTTLSIFPVCDGRIESMLLQNIFCQYPTRALIGWWQNLWGILTNFS